MATKNLTGKEAIDKLQSLAEKARVCMMTTQLDIRPQSTRPMYLQEVSDDGILWFISMKDSDKTFELQKDAEIQLYFMNNGKSEYLSVYGFAEIYTDQATIDEHWSAMANAWFDGKEDSNVSIIGVRPKEMKYWDTKHGKFWDMALMVYSAVTGNQKADGGEEGKLNI